MKRRMLVSVILVAVLTSLFAVSVGANGQSDLAAVRAATAQFHRVEVAEAAGYTLPDFANECVELPGVGGMGYHYINFGLLLDLELDPLQPEIMVYAPGPNGQMRLVAVEYAVPIEEWDLAYPGETPMVLGQHLHPNPYLGLYLLHAWIWLNNPAGMFEDWNPRVSC